MTSVRNVPMPGQVSGLAAGDASGPLFVTSYDGEDLWTTVLSALDQDGTLLWQRRFAGLPSRPRVSDSGTVWINHAETLTEVAADGSVLRSHTLAHVGAFVVLPDGLCTASPQGNVTRYDENGAVRWSTPIDLDVLIVVQGRPRTVELSFWAPLLVSGNRIAAGFADGSTGIAATWFLDLTTGELVGVTPRGPQHCKAIAGPGEFLVGSQGYGEFSTSRYDASGRETRRWASHVMPLVDRHGGIRGPEYENCLPSRSRFRCLDQDGTVRGGPPLSEYYTTYPALDRDGTAVFWRDGRLLAVDASFELRELFALPDERSIMSRILLLRQGKVVFTLDDELLIFSGTGLGPLDTGWWPCGDGNLRGNPVSLP